MLGSNKSKELVQLVWEKALVLPGLDKDQYRADHCGAMIRRDQYNDTSQKLSMGWEIDHIRPLTFGGTHDLSNLQPLQWENNRQKKEEYPVWACLVKAINGQNNYIDW